MHSGYKTSDTFYLRTIEDLMTMCNGLGPEWFPEKYRNKVTRLIPKLEAPSMPHDEGFCTTDKTKKEFKKLNKEFRYNGMIEVGKIPWSDYKEKIALYFTVRFFYWLLKRYGWKAFLEAKINEVVK
jgi:hypothetical protein